MGLGRALGGGIIVCDVEADILNYAVDLPKPNAMPCPGEYSLPVIRATHGGESMS